MNHLDLSCFTAVDLIGDHPSQGGAAKVIEQPMHRVQVALPVGVSKVDHQQEHIGIQRLLQRGAEGFHQWGGEIADEAHRVGEQ